MTAASRERERIRWRCRRGMLELDLVLTAYLERYLGSLDLAGLETLNGLLSRTDPELLDLLMGPELDPAAARSTAEFDMLAVMRSLTCSERSTKACLTQVS